MNFFGAAMRAWCCLMDVFNLASAHDLLGFQTRFAWHVDTLRLALAHGLTAEKSKNTLFAFAFSVDVRRRNH